MVKQSYYFSHDSNARNDPKICELRAEFGWEGYGIFWGLIEIMSEQENYSISREKLKYIAFSMNLKPAKLERYVCFMTSNGLLVECDGCLTSKSLLERMRQKEEKSNKMRANAAKKHNKNNTGSGAIAEQNESKSSANDEQNESKSSALNKGKETNKGNESKENKIKLTSWFGEFYESYPLSEGRKPALDKFINLNPSEELFKKIMDAVEHQKGSEKWIGGFIKAPKVWLNQECWNDKLKMAVVTTPTNKTGIAQLDLGLD